MVCKLNKKGDGMRQQRMSVRCAMPSLHPPADPNPPTRLPAVQPGDAVILNAANSTVGQLVVQAGL